MRRGELAPDEQVTISEAAEALAGSGDGVVPLKAGEQITVRELLVGTLLPSSNECALCLAEAIEGSEEAFVWRMNEKAQELGLSQAVFLTGNGLPVYTQDMNSRKTAKQHERGRYVPTGVLSVKSVSSDYGHYFHEGGDAGIARS